MEIRARFVHAHHQRQRDAEAAVAAQREARAAEIARMTQPHPMTQHPFVQTPIPGSLLPKNSPRKIPSPGKSIK
jgi:hypothetical protein